MLKKTILAVLLMGLFGILVWGGVNRTLAKTNPTEGRNANNQSKEHIELADGSGVQQRGNGNQNGSYDTYNEEGTVSLESISEQGADSSYTADAGNQVQGNSNRGSRGSGNSQGGGSNPLTATEIEALRLALDDEYHALAVYQAVITTFGEVDPFVEIAASEQRHIDALINQYDKYGLAIPENPWIGNVPTFDSLQQACQAGVAAEIDNTGLYDQLFSMTDDPSLTRVFTNLSNASLNTHLPQFEACQ